MTGYGKAEIILPAGKLMIEIRTLNGKNADISIKTAILPKDKELQVRQLLASELQRGNIDFFMNFEPNAVESAKQINKDIVTEYYRQVSDISSMIGAGNMDGNLILPAILRMPDVIDARKEDIINDGNWPEVLSGIQESIARVDEFRQREGAILYKDVTSKVNNIMAFSREVEKYEKERTDNIKEKILSRFKEIQIEPDGSRLEQEMIYYLEKLDINEEKVRLRQHCNYFMDTIDHEAYPGKKLGFIAQEMGREINTTGSKANHTEIQKLVVKMKDELEKIKEQSLNIL